MTDAMPDQPDQIVEHAYAFLRGHSTADIQFEDNIRPLKYIIAPADGRLIMPVMEAMLHCVDNVLFVPECIEHSMEVMITLERFDEEGSEHGALADQWRIYHGEPEDVRWALASIDAARFQQCVIDGDALMQPNALASDVGRICKQINTPERIGDLRTLVERYADTDVEQPRLVGIDPRGLDVRRKFDVVRVAFPEPVESADAALTMIDTMLKEA